MGCTHDEWMDCTQNITNTMDFTHRYYVSSLQDSDVQCSDFFLS